MSVLLAIGLVFSTILNVVLVRWIDEVSDTAEEFMGKYEALLIKVHNGGPTDA